MRKYGYYGHMLLITANLWIHEKCVATCMATSVFWSVRIYDKNLAHFLLKIF